MMIIMDQQPVNNGSGQQKSEWYFTISYRDGMLGWLSYGRHVFPTWKVICMLLILVLLGFTFSTFGRLFNIAWVETFK